MHIEKKWVKNTAKRPKQSTIAGRLGPKKEKKSPVFPLEKEHLGRKKALFFGHVSEQNKKTILLPRRDGRVVDCGSLENC